MKPTILLYANCQGDQMRTVTGRIRALRESCSLERVFLGALQEFIDERGRADAEMHLKTISVVWEQSSQANLDERIALRGLIPKSARWLRFPALTCSALWPFGASDTRPGGADLYPYSDILAARLWREMNGAGAALDDVDDDVIFDRYMEQSRKVMPNLDRGLERDILQWQQRDRDSDVTMTDFLVKHLRTNRLFYTAGRGTWLPTAEILRHLLHLTIDDVSLREQSMAELDCLSRSYIGNDSISVPIHPSVAQHLDLSWYNSTTLSTWCGHRWDFREWIIRCVRLSQYN